MIIEIIPNRAKDRGYKITDKAVDILLSLGCDIYISDPEYNFDKKEVKRSDIETIPDVIIALGGDGSIMRAANRAARLGVPILGINLGKVGYLAELEPNETDLLTQLIKNDFTVERRSMFDVKLIRGERTVKEDICLNDAVISHGSQLKIIETEVSCNGSSLGKFRSDGYIISTPTGTTAYSLSAGGPVVDPALEGICLVPICPYSLTARPIIISDKSTVEIKYISSGRSDAILTVDGKSSSELMGNDRIVITKSRLTADFIKIKKDQKNNFYRKLREKMSEPYGE